MQRPREENIDVRWKIIVFYVVNNFESVCDCWADAELRFNVSLRAHLPPNVFVVHAAIELGVFEKTVEVF